MTNYTPLFQEAVAHSKDLRLFDKEITFNDERYIAEWLMFELGPKIGTTFSQVQFINFLSQPQNAIRLHHFFKPIVDSLLKIDSIITIGYVEVPNDANEIEVFGTTTFEEYKTALDSKVLPEKIHSWITLPSGEILDLAFMSIYGILYNEESLYGNLVAKHPTQLTGGMTYTPLLVGEKLFSFCEFDFSFDPHAFDTKELEDL